MKSIDQLSFGFVAVGGGIRGELLRWRRGLLGRVAITGALRRLFGWQRACVLFEQVERHLMGKRRTVGWPPRDTGIKAMIALQDFSDRVDTTFDLLRERLEAMPVWSSGSRTSGSAVEA